MNLKWGRLFCKIADLLMRQFVTQTSLYWCFTTSDDGAKAAASPQILILSASPKAPGSRMNILAHPSPEERKPLPRFPIASPSLIPDCSYFHQYSSFLDSESLRLTLSLFAFCSYPPARLTIAGTTCLLSKYSFSQKDNRSPKC